MIEKEGCGETGTQKGTEIKLQRDLKKEIQKDKKGTENKEGRQ